MSRKSKPHLKVKLNFSSSLKGRFNISIESIEVKALDISVSGIGLLSKLSLPRGIVMDIQLRVKNKNIRTKGKICSTVAVGKGLARMGIKFINLNKTNAKFIKAFIVTNEKRQPRLKLLRKGLSYGKKK